MSTPLTRRSQSGYAQNPAWLIAYLDGSGCQPYEVATCFGGGFAQPRPASVPLLSGAWSASPAGAPAVEARLSLSRMTSPPRCHAVGCYSIPLSERHSVNIRSYHPDDLNALIELTIATFGPFYEDHFRPLAGEVIFHHQHGRWADDYRAQVPALHDPAAGKHVAVAETG